MHDGSLGKITIVPSPGMKLGGHGTVDESLVACKASLSQAEKVKWHPM